MAKSRLKFIFQEVLFSRAAPPLVQSKLKTIYVSTGIIRGFEDYIRNQEGQLRIHLLLDLQSFQF